MLFTPGQIRLFLLVSIVHHACCDHIAMLTMSPCAIFSPCPYTPTHPPCFPHRSSYDPASRLGSSQAPQHLRRQPLVTQLPRGLTSPPYPTTADNPTTRHPKSYEPSTICTHYHPALRHRKNPLTIRKLQSPLFLSSAPLQAILIALSPFRPSPFGGGLKRMRSSYRSRDEVGSASLTAPLRNVGAPGAFRGLASFAAGSQGFHVM